MYLVLIQIFNKETVEIKKKGKKSAWGWLVSLYCMYIGKSYRMCRKLCEE